MKQAIFLHRTAVHGHKKIRYECPKCGFRFNRSDKRTGNDRCVNCKTELELKQ